MLCERCLLKFRKTHLASAYFLYLMHIREDSDSIEVPLLESRNGDGNAVGGDFIEWSGEILKLGSDFNFGSKSHNDWTHCRIFCSSPGSPFPNS